LAPVINEVKGVEMNWFKRLIRNGNLTQFAADGMGISGIAIIWGTAYLFEDWSGLGFWILMSIGTVVGYFGAYGGLAKKFGFSPLTKDPLGWREAKETYKTRNDEVEENK
jgi:hypothetical protein